MSFPNLTENRSALAVFIFLGRGKWTARAVAPRGGGGEVREGGLLGDGEVIKKNVFWKTFLNLLCKKKCAIRALIIT